jgi:transposase
MARAYSLDLRERVVAAVGSGQSCREVAARFGLAVSTVVKWRQRYRATGDMAAKPRGGSKLRALVDVKDWVLGRVAAEPHVTTRALAAELTERGRDVSHVSMGERMGGPTVQPQYYFQINWLGLEQGGGLCLHTAFRPTAALLRQPERSR